MFEYFQKAVRDGYLDLKENRKLDFSREWPSTGDLKNWSIQCFEKGLSPEDEVVFTDFFREKDEKKQQKLLGKSLKEIVKVSETDKFRALRNFIIGDTKRSPERDVVKFLAILINFQPRPYDFNYWNSLQSDTTISCKHSLHRNKESDDHNCNNENCSDDNKDAISNDLTNPEEVPNAIVAKKNDSNHSSAICEEENKVEIEEVFLTKNNPTAVSEVLEKGEKLRVRTEKKPFIQKNKYTLRFAGIASLIVAIFFAVHYLTPEDCMCWNGERYIEVDCQDKTQRYRVIGLDQEKLEHFRKITRPDTLGIKDMGTIWYSKIDNEIEFFTAPGYHPIQTMRSLKATTKHIFETYAGQRTENNQNKQYGIMQKQ
ncbi:hypothetical protein D7322_26700 [Sphingobacterium puteale]|uniref:Uncharacterized protein n=1 Tax=Sphingobacterium puteale TaxID=2420510 RepID=A0A420VQC2_9SPHI|nr:hypothetical protein [Sphingobacterium puteale]RKO68528.1 hypothetical protein D7322_26700 [Sphingobacterium puteale]